MSCANCSECTPVPACVNQIIIGTIPDLSTNVYVVLRDVTSGRKTTFQTTSSNAGVVSIDTTGFMFPENHSYEITILKTLLGVPVNITINAVVYDCVGVRFEKIRDDAGLVLTVATHTLRIAA